MIAIPQETPSGLFRFFLQIVEAISQLQTPQRPAAVYACTQANLPAASSYRNCVAVVTDKNTLAVSTLSGGTWAWTRADGSAL